MRPHIRAAPRRVPKTHSVDRMCPRWSDAADCGRSRRCSVIEPGRRHRLVRFRWHRRRPNRLARMSPLAPSLRRGGRLDARDRLRERPRDSRHERFGKIAPSPGWCPSHLQTVHSCAHGSRGHSVHFSSLATCSASTPRPRTVKGASWWFSKWSIPTQSVSPIGQPTEGFHPGLPRRGHLEVAALRLHPQAEALL